MVNKYLIKINELNLKKKRILNSFSKFYSIRYSNDLIEK